MKDVNTKKKQKLKLKKHQRAIVLLRPRVIYKKGHVTNMTHGEFPSKKI